MIEVAIVTAIRARLTTALAPSGEPLRPLCVDDHAAGWLNAHRAARLAAFADIFRVDDDAIRFVRSLSNAQARTEALDRVTGALAAEGALTAWRDERYAIAPRFGAPPRFLRSRRARRAAVFSPQITSTGWSTGKVPPRCGSPAAAQLSRSTRTCSTT
jgi:hypothetical protein